VPDKGASKVYRAEFQTSGIMKGTESRRVTVDIWDKTHVGRGKSMSSEEKCLAGKLRLT